MEMRYIKAVVFCIQVLFTSSQSTTGGYYLGTKGFNACPSASAPTSAACLAAAQSVLPAGTTQGRTTLVTGSWAYVPPGCSVQSGGDWAAHFNSGTGNNDGSYTPVCMASCRAGSIIQTNWNCDNANMKTLTQAVACNSRNFAGIPMTQCVDNIDRCAQIAAADPDCSNLIRYYGSSAGPSGNYAGWCTCIRKGLGCGGWGEGGGNVAPIDCQVLVPTWVTYSGTGSFTYAAATSTCSTLGGILCTRTQYCLNGQINSNIAGFENGQVSAAADKWAPYSDATNGWIHTSNTAWPYCKDHILDLGAAPGWGLTGSSWGTTMCCQIPPVSGGCLLWRSKLPDMAVQWTRCLEPMLDGAVFKLSVWHTMVVRREQGMANGLQHGNIWLSKLLTSCVQFDRTAVLGNNTKRLPHLCFVCVYEHSEYSDVVWSW